ncbi:DNA-methyltransferase [Streptomyces phytophilus]|uniref:DNA-methyltransferase n=1 Tax=Streptomyces phytophilus TaxID=722715 RepID=UPI0015F1218C|nr:site-specific DNA-methyltransferase [Streptomyces phytophilus]
MTLLTGDATAALRALPDDVVDCVVTSPPYWRLRDYATGAWTGGQPDCPHPPAAHTEPAGQHRCSRCAATWHDRQHGLEPTLTSYIDHLRQAFTELRRVLTPTGTVWLILGDSYAANSDGYHTSGPLHYRQPHYRPRADLPPKNLIGVPWHTAFALQADGWILRNAAVWHKPNAAPFPVRDRLALQHETVFLLVKQTHHYFEPHPPCSTTSEDTDRASSAGSRTASAAISPTDDRRGDVWRVPVRPRRHQQHPATFPLAIPQRCIQHGSPPGALVCDPYSGTGTTGLAALTLHRAYLGIDLNPTYTKIAAEQLSHYRAPRPDHDETEQQSGDEP